MDFVCRIDFDKAIKYSIFVFLAITSPVLSGAESHSNGITRSLENPSAMTTTRPISDPRFRMRRMQSERSHTDIASNARVRGIIPLQLAAR